MWNGEKYLRVNQRWLLPGTVINQVSFWKKAKIEVMGSRVGLYSYGTLVGFIRNGRFHKTHPWYSATTLRHVREFCALYNVANDPGIPWYRTYKSWWNHQRLVSPTEYYADIGYEERYIPNGIY